LIINLPARIVCICNPSENEHDRRGVVWREFRPTPQSRHCNYARHQDQSECSRAPTPKYDRCFCSIRQRCQSCQVSDGAVLIIGRETAVSNWRRNVRRCSRTPSQADFVQERHIQRMRAGCRSIVSRPRPPLAAKHQSIGTQEVGEDESFFQMYLSDNLKRFLVHVPLHMPCLETIFKILRHISEWLRCDACRVAGASDMNFMYRGSKKMRMSQPSGPALLLPFPTHGSAPLPASPVAGALLGHRLPHRGSRVEERSRPV
jgi:hypothetical protein